MKIMLFTRILIVGSVVALAFTQARAQETSLTQYDVELIIFRNLGATGTAENWALEEALAKQRGVIPEDDEGAAASQTPQPRASQEVNVTPLASGQFKLTAVEDTLRRSRTYQPLAHIGWTQLGYPLQGAPFVSVSPLLPAGVPLTGQIALSRGHYLHLTLDLVYQAGNPQPYVLRQSRRMKSGEKHYFDHPAFGVIALVTPHT
jgi:hypothetical protein